MRRRRPVTTWLALLLALAAVTYFGGRWLLLWAYPLEYKEMLFPRAQEYRLDPYLVAAVIRTESRFRADATSGQGARGLMQIMPETGEWAARQLKLRYSPALLYDPDFNIRLGCWYLDNLRQEFGGDLVLALAAYNGGRTNVMKWLQENQWTGEHATLEQIPFKETRLYVARVLRDYQRYRWIYGANQQEGRKTDAGQTP